MEYIHGTKDFKLEGASAVTLGKFDGVHLGHQGKSRRDGTFVSYVHI